MIKGLAVRIFAFLLASVSALLPRASFDESCIFLRAEYNAEYELLMLDVRCEEFDVCGLLLEVGYDSENLVFTSVMRREAKPSLDFSSSLDGDGQVILLFDGEENDSSGGRLATLCFKLKEKAPLRFTLSCPDSESAYSIGEDGFEEINIEEKAILFNPAGCRLRDRFFDKIKAIFKR